jgi:hypothetical protein
MRFSQSAFADYHRARRIRAGLTAAGWTAAASAVIGALILVGVASPSRVEASSVVATSATTTVGSLSTASVPTTAASPEPSATQLHPSSPATAVPAPSGPAAFQIVVTATGYQAELNACQWVRMNLLGTAPFVGAHTSCGGAEVLTMKVGDLVTLDGQGLDGTYRVTGSRDAHAGDLATTATAGMTASVVLQTCYHGTGGRERLVGLELIP